MALRYGAVALTFALILTALVKTQTALSLIASWLICVNIVTFFLYAYDKSIAGSDAPGMRVPERVLLFITFVGGTPGAWISMQVFRHKVSKRSFQQGFWLIVLLQVVLAIAFLVLFR
jgi:uncharacterized membrane protein YsdA (DUF1294 family)